MIDSSAEYQQQAHGTDTLSHAPEIETEISPESGWGLIGLREIWQYRELLYLLSWRDVTVRYKQTILGASWAILKPTLLMVIFTLFLRRMGQVPAQEPYAIFVFAGLLPWVLFSTGVTSAANSVVGSEHLITKVYFPRILIPIAAMGPALVDFLVAISMLVVLMMWYGVFAGWAIIYIGLPFALLVLASAGVGILLAGLNVAYRDVRHIVPFLIQAWLFATPTIYMDPGAVRANEPVETALAETNDVSASRDAGGVSVADRGGLLQFVLLLNPLVGVISFFRATTLGGPLPWAQLGCSAMLIAIIFLGACFYFRRVEDSFADII